MTDAAHLEPPAYVVAADVALFTLRDERLCVLLIDRGGEPRGWALPGGFVRPDEDVDAAAARKLEEETGLSGEARFLEQLRTYGHPQRDPRKRAVAVAYVAIVPDAGDPVHGAHEIAQVRWWPVDELDAATPARVRPRPDRHRRARAGPLQARVHAAGDRIHAGAVHAGPVAPRL